MAYDANAEDLRRLQSDPRSPKSAIEGRTVGTTAVTFSHPLTGGIGYAIYSNGATGYYTLEGTAPTLADGTSAKGLPAPNGLFEFIGLAPGETATLKVIVSGSVSSFVTLLRTSLSSSY